MSQKVALIAGVGLGTGAALARDPDRAIETVIQPDAIADAVLNAFRQPRNAWTQEVDIRPAVEVF
ncbi:MAG TPA: hypothetical protein VJ646_06050 [Candidatus Binatia bacterium]|nr:hypothetical protein [Candidatus Binatia bacterium]